MRDEPPQHTVGCDGSPATGPCAACKWHAERYAENVALLKFRRLFDEVPINRYTVFGRG